MARKPREEVTPKRSNRWTPEDDSTLRICASEGLSAAEAATVLNRTPAAVSGRASALEVSFNSRNDGGLRQYLGDGGHVIREDCGGAVGIRWCTATRSGQSFPPALCERLTAIGIIRQSPDGTFQQLSAA